MKILMIVSEAPPIISGISRCTAEISDGLRRRGHVVDIVSSNDIPRLEIGELRLSSMAWKGVGPVFSRLNEYDIVNIHGPAPTFSDVALLSAAVTRKFGGPPVVYTHHCEIELPGKEWLCAPYNLTHRALANMADHVVVMSPSYQVSFPRLLAHERISVIPIGGAETRPPTTKPDGFNVLFVGQMRPYKGLDLLLRAYSQMTDARLTIIGSGHREQEYRALAEELELRNVQFLGKASSEEVAAAYADAHTIVLPSLSRAEAFGLVLLEGMAAGCVPIASNLPGVRDVIGESGYTFETGNVEALRSTLVGLQRDRETRQRLSEAAPRWAAQFSWDLTVSGYDRLFSAVAVQSASRSLNLFPAIDARNWGTAATSFVRDSIFKSLPDLSHAMNSLFKNAVEEIGASRASFITVDIEDVLVIAAHKGMHQHLLGMELSTSASISGWVAANAKPVLIDPIHAPQEIRRLLRQPDLASALSVPVFMENHIVGVVNLARQAGETPYTVADLNRLVHEVSLAKPLLGQMRQIAA